jgi:hypothetical protein
MPRVVVGVALTPWQRHHGLSLVDHMHGSMPTARDVLRGEGRRQCSVSYTEDITTLTVLLVGWPGGPYVDRPDF